MPVFASQMVTAARRDQAARRSAAGAQNATASRAVAFTLLADEAEMAKGGRDAIILGEKCKNQTNIITCCFFRARESDQRPNLR